MMEGFGSYWIANIVNAGLEDKVGVCAVPEGSSRFSNCYSLSVYAGSKHPDLAMKLVEELSELLRKMGKRVKVMYF